MRCTPSPTARVSVKLHCKAEKSPFHGCTSMLERMFLQHLPRDVFCLMFCVRCSGNTL